LGTKRAGGIEWITIILVVSLFVIGFFAILNATGAPGDIEGASLSEVISRINWSTVRLHSIWFGTGAALATLLVLMDYRFFARITPILYIAMIAVLLFVLAFASETYGSTSWIKTFFGRTVQPSELMKIVLIIVLAKLLSKYSSQTGTLAFRDYVRIWLVALIPLGLVVLQQDLGTAIVYLVIIVIMFYLAGARIWMLLLTGGAAAGAFVAAWTLDILKNTQKQRILVFLDPTLDPSGAGWNFQKALMAMGSGQLTGKGMFAPGAMSQLNYIPVQTKDFIYAVIGETFGFVGAGLVMLLFLLLLLRLFRLSGRIKEKFGALIIGGVAAMLAFHALESMGMCIGAMPITGIPLPFVSYGGSNMWTNLLGIGLVLSVCMRNPYHRDAEQQGMYFSQEMLHQNQIGFNLRSSWQSIVKARRERAERRRKYGG